MSIPEETLDAIRARCDIVAIISQYVTLKRRGKNYLGLCPFHAEKTPSFNVLPDRGIWKCFGCGQGGNVFTFLMRVDGLTFQEAVDRLAGQVGITVQRDAASAERRSLRDQVFEANKAAAAFFAEQLGRAPAAREYLARRGLTPDTLTALGIGYAPDAWSALSDTLLRRAFAGEILEKAGLSRARETGGYYDVFRHRIIFPIRDVEGRVLAFGGRALGDVQPKYLNSPETPVFEKSRTLYALDRARRAISAEGVAVVVEGYMDAATAHQHGVANVVATLGTALGPGHLEILRRYAPRVVLAYDGDAAGAAAAERSVPLFESAEMDGRILILPAGQDPDDFLKGVGQEGFRQAVAEALPLVEFQLRRLEARGDHASPEGRAALAREVAPVLVGIRSPVKREEYVRRLAENWCAGDLHRVPQVEDAIRREMQRSRGGRAGSATHPTGGSGSAPATSEPGPRSSSRHLAAGLGALAAAERFVLQGLMQRAIPAERIFDALRPEDFQVAGHQRLAALLWEQRDRDPLETAQQAARGEDEIVAGVVSQLLLQQEELPATAKTVNDSLWRIKERRIRGRIDHLQACMAQPERFSNEEYHKLADELRRLVRELSDKKAGQP